MKPIYYYIILISLLIHGLTAWGEDADPQNASILKSSIPSISAFISDSKKSAAPDPSIITIQNVPINNSPTPIIITVNTPASQPIIPSGPPANVLPMAPPKQFSAPSKSDVSISGASRTNTISIPPTPTLNIVIDRKYLNSPKIHKLYRMLGIPSSPRIIQLVADRDLVNKREGRIMIQPRSFVGVLGFLSNAVEVYPEMLRQKLVISPKYPNGEYFNLNNLTKGLLAIHISPTRPHSNVNVQVYYRNHWFYIADTDYKSKRTLSMIGQLFNLQAGEIKGQTSPVITIPTR